MTNEQKYHDLIKSYKELKKLRDNYLNELSEKKGNLAAYESEKIELTKKAKDLGVEPSDLKKEIDKLSITIEKQLENMKNICEELEKEKIG